MKIGAPETLRMVPSGPPPPLPHMPAQREAYQESAQRPVAPSRAAPQPQPKTKTPAKSIDVRV
jgi:hypothetical protein